jgi:fructose-bisphosphate aldolase class II
MLLDALQSRVAIQHALENRYAILAINADSHAAMGDCLEAAYQMDAPVIIETSLWQIEGQSFGAGDPVLGVARYIANLALLANCERYKNIPVIYHTDHIKGPKTFAILEPAIRGIHFSIHDQELTLRASTISLDASEFTHDQTIQHISHLCAFADKNNVDVTLEMEDAVDEGITSSEVAAKLLGTIESDHPNKIYLWAPGVGTQHGFGDNMHFSPETIEEQVTITKKVTGREIGIALHGSTGLSAQDLSSAAKAGVVKVNWSTESLYIRSNAAKEFYETMADKLNKKHKDWKATAMDNGVSKYVSASYIPKVLERMQILGGERKATEIMKLFEKAETYK